MVLVVLVELFSQRLLANHNQRMEKRQVRENLSAYALALQRQIGFYQHQLEGLASRADVQDLLEFGDQDKAFLWAMSYRKLLPDTVGLSLISNNGEIQGDPGSLLIGPQCRADIVKLSQGIKIASPSVHRDQAGLEHFDLFAPVNNVNGERTGYVFASIELSVVQDILDTMTQDGHKLTVVAGDQTPVASVNHFIGKAEGTFQLTLPIHGTTWRITLVSQPRGMEKAFTTLLIATGLMALVFGISVVLLSRRLSRGLLREIDSIRISLDQIAEDSDKPVDIQPQFRETAPLMDAVQDISNRIQLQKESLRQLSETDSLTGLLNRRCFIHELEKAWALANRKVQIYVMTLDIDGFKQINDRYGHAVGDQVLKALTECLNDCARSTDVIARLGGDEFVILLVQSDEAAGLTLFERLRDCFEQAQTTLPIDIGMYCTLSAGLATVDSDIDTSAEASLRRSDEALYRAKQGGRNQMRQ